MSSSRIEQIIEEIEEYVENCRYQPLSTTKIIVNKEGRHGICLQATQNIYAKNQIDSRKACAVEDFTKFGMNKEEE